jgi:ABC-type sugar transport system permease subunit
LKFSKLWLLPFLAPYTIGLCLFVLGPMFFSLYLSGTKWSLFGQASWIGLQNFDNMIQDDIFWLALRNTAYYALMLVPGELLCALLLALLLNTGLRAIGFFRAVYFTPYVMSLVSVGLVWAWFLTPNFGLLSQILQALHLPAPAFLQTRDLAMPAVAATSVWRNTGYYTVLLLAGLQSVPREMEEAASVDGASGLARFRYITLPFLSPTLFVALVIATIWAAQVFDLTYIMTLGGPENATLTIVQYIYNSAFANGKMGYASAMSWALLLIMLALTVLYFFSQRWWVHYE